VTRQARAQPVQSAGDVEFKFRREYKEEGQSPQGRNLNDTNSSCTTRTKAGFRALNRRAGFKDPRRQFRQFDFDAELDVVEQLGQMRIGNMVAARAHHLRHGDQLVFGNRPHQKTVSQLLKLVEQVIAIVDQAFLGLAVERIADLLGRDQCGDTADRGGASTPWVSSAWSREARLSAKPLPDVLVVLAVFDAGPAADAPRFR